MIVVHASNFRPVKRIQDVVRVFALIHSQIPSRLILVGDGPELPRAAELATRFGVRGQVAATLVRGEHCPEDSLARPRLEVEQV